MIVLSNQFMIHIITFKQQKIAIYKTKEEVLVKITIN
jgi:hypothetical protein